MAKQRWMTRFARWHIWLGWLVGVPIVMWMVTGLVMVARPIDAVRGNHLRIDQAEQALPLANPAPVLNEIDVPRTVREIRTFMQRGRPVTLVTRLDGSTARFNALDGVMIEPLDEQEARELVAKTIKGGNMIAAMRLFAADKVPFDFRRPIDVWQAELADGTRIYVGQYTGEIEAVRTRWWRLFDFMWGLHIMDLEAREDTSHPILILFAALGLTGSLLGTILMFRRRKARPSP